jgi:tetrahydrodipicolinate N-succinyltransferase
MKPESKSLLLSITKEKIDQKTESLIRELDRLSTENAQQQLVPTHFHSWLQNMTWRGGFKNSEEKLKAVETYADELRRRVAVVRDLQAIYEDIRLLPAEEIL